MHKYLCDKSMVFFSTLGEMIYVELDGWGFPRKKTEFLKAQLDFHKDGGFCTDAKILRKNTDKIMILCQKQDKNTQEDTIIIRVFDRKSLQLLSFHNKVVPSTEKDFSVTSRLSISIMDEDKKGDDS